METNDFHLNKVLSEEQIKQLTKSKKPIKVELQENTDHSWLLKVFEKSVVNNENKSHYLFHLDSRVHGQELWPLFRRIMQAVGRSTNK